MTITGARDHAQEERDFPRVYWTFSVLALLGVATSAVYAFSVAAGASAGRIFGAAVLISGASGLMGALAGFLFAIPRSRQDQQLTATVPGDASGRRMSDYSANTNLEQISDWLTKILVGAGLVQLSEIPGLFDALSTNLAPALGAVPAPQTDAFAKPVALCLMLYFLPWGFFFAYLITRLWLPRALGRAERGEVARNREVETEDRAYKALYESPPSGFRKALEIIHTYQAQSYGELTPWLWVYLAIAQGQRHKYETEMGNQREAEDARSAAVHAAKMAVVLSPPTRAVIADVYRGGHPTDNDLNSLNPDPGLDELIAGT